MYIHQCKQWPNFTWDKTQLVGLLAEVRHLQGRLLGKMSGLGFPLQKEATYTMLIEDVLNTSKIEGEYLDPRQVRSSIAKKLGIQVGFVVPVERHVEGVVKVVMDAVQHHEQPLTEKRLFSWHKALFPPSEKSIHQMTIGAWRTLKSGHMRVVSGAYGRERIHFEAPNYDRLKLEMKQFLDWSNEDSLEKDLVIKSAIAHFWFVTIHPFDDGNGRIARAISDMFLARSERTHYRFYSMSSQIQQERDAYYQILERCQKDGVDITPWIEWYLGCLNRAIIASEIKLEKIITKASFWSLHAEDLFNIRQRKILNLLLDDFYGKLNSSKWAKIAKCSPDTALRDINDLVLRKILRKSISGGRSTSYELVNTTSPWHLAIK